MVDTILSKASQPAGTIARLKVSAPAAASESTGLSTSEQQLSDIIDLSDTARQQIQKNRKLDAALRMFNNVLKLVNGRAPRYVPQFSKVEVEFVKPSSTSVKTEA